MEIYIVAQTLHYKIAQYIKTLKKSNSKLKKLELLVAEEAQGLGDCLRIVGRENIITYEFVLIRGLTISNFNLEEVFNLHLEKKAQDKTYIMTSIFCSHNNEYNLKSGYDDSVVVYNKNSNQILQFEHLGQTSKLQFNSNKK